MPAIEADFVPPAEEISVDYPAGEAMPVQLHDGSRVVLRKLGASYDPTDRSAAYAFIEQKLKQNEYVTGLIHINEIEQPPSFTPSTSRARCRSIAFRTRSCRPAARRSSGSWSVIASASRVTRSR